MSNIPMIMMLSGELILAYSVFYCIKISKKVKRILKEGRESSNVIDAYLLLIIFFAVGYLTMLCSLKYNIIHVEILMGIIFFLGSIFVFISLFLIYSLFRLLTNIKLNQTDPSTGLLNKEAGMHYIRNKLEEDTGTWVLYVLDLNSFKTVNDTYGHMIGDQVINTVATALRNSTAGEDIVFRFGGDEFAVFSQSSSDEEIRQKGKKIYDGVARAECRTGDKSLYITGSIGAVKGRYPETAEKLFERADDAMYHAKREKSCNCFFEI